MTNINKQDKYKAIWMSHSSMGDYEKCHRLYYLHNIYKNKDNKKINITSPYMSLGIAVHNVVEALKTLKSDDRKKIIESKKEISVQENGKEVKTLVSELIYNFEEEWGKYVGKVGGFENEIQREEFKNRGVEMIKNVISDPKMLLSKTISTKSYYDGDMLPNYYISEEENIILCGNVDWIEYMDPNQENKNGSLKVIDFKTGKNEEKIDSPQLFIYKLLIEKLGCKWPVTQGAYWYFENSSVVEKDLNDVEFMKNLEEKIIKIGVEIRDKRYIWSEKARFNKPGWLEKENFANNFKCNNTSQFCDCKKYELIINNDPGAEYVGVDMYGKDSYFVNK